MIQQPPRTKTKYKLNQNTNQKKTQESEHSQCETGR
jgi:hypothetical protein